MRRWIGHGLCASLTVAALLTAGVGLASCWDRNLDYEVGTGEVFERVGAWKGSVGIVFIRELEQIYASDEKAWKAAIEHHFRDWAVFGFHYGAGEGSAWGPSQRGLATKWRTDATMFLIPGWLAVAILGVFPAWWFRRCMRERRVRRRSSRGLCVGCGYDLRATRDRCPECGRSNGRFD